MDREFPFNVPKEKKDVETALQIFQMLWHNHVSRSGKFTTRALTTVFHKYISDSVSYNGGWRRGKYWSPAAWKAVCMQGSAGGLGLKCKHVVPRSCVLAHAMELDTYEQAEEFVVRTSFVCVITDEENRRLNAAGLASSHPDVNDPWVRYASLEQPIMVLDVPGFLTTAEQDALRRHGILAEIGDLPYVQPKTAA